MLRTFNCGIGMVLVVAADARDTVCRMLADSGEACYVIGEYSRSRVLCGHVA